MATKKELEEQYAALEKMYHDDIATLTRDRDEWKRKYQKAVGGKKQPVKRDMKGMRHV